MSFLLHSRASLMLSCAYTICGVFPGATVWSQPPVPASPVVGGFNTSLPPADPDAKLKPGEGLVVPVPDADGKDPSAAHADLYQLPVGMDPFVVPEANPMTRAKIELGRKLYFDKRLSGDRTVSCASCHDPEKGWSNGDAVATGVGGQKGGRSAPTIINSAYASSHFWDGRASDLEDQALGPIQNPIEMNLSLDELEKRLRAIQGYQDEFGKVFEDGVTSLNAARAIASFERTIVSGDAPFDRFQRGDKTALSEQAQQGMKLFFGRANCSACHVGPHFADSAFHNIGVGMDAETPDPGRAAHSKLAGDTGAFRTPTLREIARTGPYMHDGRFKTLREVVDYYNQGGTENDYLDEEIYKLDLDAKEIEAIVAFLKEGLTSETYPMVKPPKLPE